MLRGGKESTRNGPIFSSMSPLATPYGGITDS